MPCIYFFLIIHSIFYTILINLYLSFLIKVSPKRRHLIIGTSLGLVSLFDFYTEIFKWFGHASDLYQYGSVTAVDVSYEEEMLVAGHENGTLCVYDLVTGKLLKAFSTVHKFAVLAIKFYHDKGKSLSLSKGGKKKNITLNQKILIIIN